jgi:glycosyltransferase involved in cell wall biosynthesis
MSPPIVSVIVPVYNAEPYLRECLESLREQSLRDIEIIIVDDCSSDRGPASIKAFAASEKRTHCIRHATNRGLGAAYNSGLAVARGEYIAFVEPDDWVEKDFLGSLLDAARSTGASVTRCGFRHVHCDGSGEESPHFADLEQHRIYRRQLSNAGHMALGYIGFWAGLYQRHFLEANGIRFLELSGAGYVDTHFFWLTHALAGELAVIRKTGYNYRLGNPSSSIKCRDKRWFAMVTNYVQARNDLRQRGKLDGHEPLLIRAATRAYASVFAQLASELRKEFCDLVSRSFRDVSDSVLDQIPADHQEKSTHLAFKRNTYYRDWAEPMVYSDSWIEKIVFAWRTLWRNPYALTSDEFWELSAARSSIGAKFIYPIRRFDHRLRSALLKRGIDLFPHKQKRRPASVSG